MCKDTNFLLKLVMISTFFFNFAHKYIKKMPQIPELKEYEFRLSKAITWLRFPLIFLIIMLHCYSVQRLEGDYAIYFKVLYPFSLWLGETGVPGFFFISGYLFFLSRKTYPQKIKSRINTLIIPYLLWNCLYLLLYLVLYAFGHPLDINRRNLADYYFTDYLRLFWDRGDFDHGNFVPLLCPMWYIRNLFILSLLSPLLYNLIKYIRELFLLVTIIWWLFTNHNAFIPQTVFFFSLGAYFSILGINPLEIISKRKIWFLILFAFFGMGDILTHTNIETPIGLHVHRLALTFNIPILLLLADHRVIKASGTRIQFLANSSFIVFCVHYPIVLILRKLCVTFFKGGTNETHILLYFICVIIVTLMSLGLYCILDKYFPKTKNILSGNR